MGNRIISLLTIFKKSASDKNPARRPKDSLLGETALSTPNASIRQSWTLLKRYLCESDEKTKARLLLAGVTGLTIAGLGGEIYISHLLAEFGTIFQTLSPQSSTIEKDSAIKLLELCVGSGLAMMVARGALWYSERTLHKNWRDWQTRSHLSQWLGDHVHSRLQNNRVIENAGLLIKRNDDSIPGDIVGLGIGLLQAAVRLPVFSYILWNLSGTAQFNILGNTISIPGYMTWGTMAFAAIGTWMGHKAGNPLSPLYTKHQNLEAEQDNEIAYVQANSESILLADGEPAAKKMLDTSMSKITDNWSKINLYETALLTLNDGYNRIGEFLPYALLFPLTMQTGFNLGILAPAVQAIMNVKSSLSWYFNSRAHIGRLRSSINQMVYLEEAMQTASQQSREHFSDRAENPSVINIKEDNLQTGITFSNLTLRRPRTNDVLFENANIKLHSGEKMILMAPAGSGKTTILRAMKGMVDEGSGQITYPAGRKRMLIPQNRHIPPTLSLSEILVYPSTDTTRDLPAMEAALQKVGLNCLIPDLYNNEIKGHHFSRRLSGGEHQKLNIARVLVIRPDELIADELTSALDDETELKLYPMLIAELPETSILNISHHKTLIPFHTTLATIENNQLQVRAVLPQDIAANDSGSSQMTLAP